MSTKKRRANTSHPGTSDLMKQDLAAITKELRACCVLKNDESVVTKECYGTASGERGESRVRFVYLRKNAGTDNELSLDVIAKFDERERAQKEWKAIRQLRRLNIGPRMVLPINRATSGPAIYRSVVGMTPREQCLPLHKYLLENLASNVDGCVDALLKALNGLSQIHAQQPGKHEATLDGKRDAWKDLFPELHGKKDDLQTKAQRVWPEVRWNNDSISPPVCEEFLKKWELRQCTNPVAALDNYMSKPPGKVYRSRIHGDLHANNIIVVPCGDTTGAPPNERYPEEVFLIDFAESRRGCPTAMDFARLEVEICLYVLPNILARASKQDRIHDALALLWRVLGRQEEQFETLGKMHAAAANAAILLGTLRAYAHQKIRPVAGDYHFAEYYIALYLTFLARFRSPRLDGIPGGPGAALLGAYLSLYGFEHPTSPISRRGSYERLAARARSVFGKTSRYASECVLESMTQVSEEGGASNTGCPCVLLPATFAYATEYFRAQDVAHDNLNIAEGLLHLHKTLKLVMEKDFRSYPTPDELNEKYAVVRAGIIFLNAAIKDARKERPSHKGQRDTSDMDRTVHVLREQCYSITDRERGDVENSLKSLRDLADVLDRNPASREERGSGGQSDDEWPMDCYKKCQDALKELPKLIRILRDRWHRHFNNKVKDARNQRVDEPAVEMKYQESVKCLPAISEPVTARKVARGLFRALSSLHQHQEDAPVGHWPKQQQEE